MTIEKVYFIIVSLANEINNKAGWFHFKIWLSSRHKVIDHSTKWTLQVLEPWKERTQEIQANMLWLVSFQKSIISTYYKVSGIVLLQTERFGVDTRR